MTEIPSSLQKLREERLQRERQEQNRTKDFWRNKFPARLSPEEVKKPEESNTEPRVPLMKQKYNSQFNPIFKIFKILVFVFDFE